MTVAAVVVRWRGGDEIDRCLQALLAQDRSVLSRVVLVDSGSGDGGAQRLARRFPDIDVLALADNRSFAHAANTGVAETDEDLVLLINPDAAVGPDVVRRLADALEHRPEAAGVVPLLTNPDGTSQHRWQLCRLPTVARLATGRSGAPAFRQSPTLETPVMQPAAAAWLVRRAVWEALDGLDESFAPAWWEDVDFCARLHRRLSDPDFPAGSGFVVIPDITVEHLGGSSLSSLEPARFLQIFFANLLRYAERHHTGHMSLIRSGLRISLTSRMLVQPSRFAAYLKILASF